MLLAFTVRHLVLASWEVSPGQVARNLPRGLEPALVDGRSALVSIVGFRNEDVRLGGRRVPSFSQLNVRTYVTREGEPAVFFLSLRVTPPGLGGVLFGAPFRPARVRVREGTVRAPGLGISLQYRVSGGSPAVPGFETGPLGTHDVGYFEAAGLRRLVAEHEPFAWQGAELVSPPRLDPVLALGFDAREPDSLLYAASTGFRAELPPRKMA